jgi:hypothetical protein
MRFFSPDYTRVIGIMWHKTDRDHVALGPSNQYSLTVTDFVEVDIGIHQGTRRSTDFAANSRDTGAG